MSGMGFVSVTWCVGTTLLVLSLQLHKFFTYRLALYQVLSSLMISVDDALVITLSSYVYPNATSFHHVMCLLTGYLLTYFIWVKLIFTTALTLHLFLLAICFKDFKKYEIVYVLVSVFVPVTFTWIPFIGGNYGPAGGWCWIKDQNSDCSHNTVGIIEQYVLFYGPWYICLSFGVIAAIIVTAVLLYRVCYQKCKNSSQSSLSENDPLLLQNNATNHRKALIEAAPLLAYPAIFFIFNIFPITHRIHNAVSKYPNFELAVMHAFVNAAWGTLASIALILHVMVSKCVQKRQQQHGHSETAQHKPTGVQDSVVYTSFTEIDTCHVIPNESTIDRIIESAVD